MTSLFALLPGLGPGEMIVLLIIGILLFGRRLPEVGRYLGRGIVEFKKGLKGLEDEVESSVASSPRPPQEAAGTLEPPRPPQRVATSAPKFEEDAGSVSPPKAPPGV